MADYDAPDWQRIVTTVSAAGVSEDAPDWQRVVVGPSGTPVGGGGGGGTGEPTPAAWGWSAWTFSPIFGSSTDHFGNIRDVGLALFIPPSDLTIADITFPCSQAGTGFVTDHNYVGIYETTVSGTSVTALDLVASSAAGAADSTWASAGSTAVALSASYKVSSSKVYYVAQLWDTGANANARPYFPYYAWGISSTFDNWPTSYVTNSRNTLTSLPSSLDPSSLVVETGARVAGVS